MHDNVNVLNAPEPLKMVKQHARVGSIGHITP